MPSRLLVVFLFATLALVFTIPLSSHPGSQTLDLGPDTRLFLWTLAWDVHALVERPLSLFDANIFYPEPRTLAYSEHQIGSALFAAPIMAATRDPLISMNLVLLFSCAMSGLGAYYLGRTLGLGTWGALGCGIVFAFTPPRFFRLGQLHLATVEWMPFCLGLLHRYARGGKTRHVLGAAGLFTLQAWSGGQTGLFLGLAALGLVLYLATFGQFRPHGKVFRDVALAALVTLALNVPFLLPYLRVQKELGLTRSLREATFWSPNKESFVASPTHVDKLVLRAFGWERHVLKKAKAYLFPGLLPLVLAGLALGRRRSPKARPPTSPRLDLAIVLVFVLAAVVGASGGIRIGSASASGGRLLVFGVLLLGARFAIYRGIPFARGYRARFRAWADARMGVPAGYYLFVSTLSLWASLGPAGGLYKVLYRFFPGFDFIRVPSRLTLLTVLGLAVLAGFGIEYLARKRRALAPLALVLVLLELAAFPLETRAYSVTTSPMDQWLAARTDQGAIVALPIPDPGDDVAAARRHSTYMLFSLAHFRPLVNGYSGFTPASHVRLFRILTTFPDDAGLTELEKLGVRHAVFHRAGYRDEDWKRVLERARALSGRLSLEASFDEGRVYEITRSSNRGS